MMLKSVSMIKKHTISAQSETLEKSYILLQKMPSPVLFQMRNIYVVITSSIMT